LQNFTAFDQLLEHCELQIIVIIIFVGLMNKYENLTIQFKTGKDNFPYAWLESRSMAGFKLILGVQVISESRCAPLVVDYTAKVRVFCRVG